VQLVVELDGGDVGYSDLQKALCRTIVFYAVLHCLVHEGGRYTSLPVRLHDCYGDDMTELS